MTPEAIASFGRGFKLGVEAERDRTRALVVEARALTAELATLRIDVARLENARHGRCNGPGCVLH
jgi:hypothetical protein